MASLAVAPPPTIAPASLPDFLVNRKEFLQEVALAQSVRETKTTIPVLSCLQLRADASGQLSIVGTDLDQTLHTTCSARVARGGSVTVPARKLFDYLRLLEGEDVAIKTLDNDRVQIRCGRSRTTMVAMSAANFPAIPEFPEKAHARLSVHQLRSLLGRVVFAISTEESRYTLNGALMQLEPGSITLVATDGHRLAFAKVAESVEGVTTSVEYLIALKGVRQLSALLATTKEDFVDFVSSESSLFFRIGTRVYSVRKMMGKFPDYRAVMPKTNDKKAIVAVKDLTETLQRVGQFANDQSPSVRLSLGANQVLISSSSVESGESEETLATTYSAEALVIGINPSFLLDALKVLGGGEVTMEFLDPMHSIVVRPETSDNMQEFRFILMPTRL
jgi:DNA polymerase-3 subunit beta